MDPDNTQIALLKAWIHALCRQSTDRPHWEYSARASAIAQSLNCTCVARADPCGVVLGERGLTR